MSSLLGVDFFRIVSEPGESDWSQVYAKVPFGQEEVLNKGGVFGVLRLFGGKDVVGKGSEIIASIEEKFNQGEGKGMLEKLFEAARGKKQGVEVGLVEIKRGADGEREMRLLANKGVVVEIVRQGRKVRLTGEKSEGKVVKGKLEEKDLLLISVGGLEKLSEEVWEKEKKRNLEAKVEILSSELMKEKRSNSMAGLFLEVKKMEVEEAEERVEEKEEGTGLIEKELGQRIEPRLSVEKKELGWWKKVKQKLGRRKRDGGSVQLRMAAGGGRKKKWSVFVGGLFLAALAVSVTAGYFKMKKEKQREEFRMVYEPLEKKREDALVLVELNPLGSMELMREAREEMKAHEGEFAESEFESEWKGLSERMEQGWERVSGEEQIETELFFDLGLIRGEIKGERLVVNDQGELVALDRQLGVVVMVGSKKETEMVMGKGEGREWQELAWVKGEAVVLSGKDLVVKDKVVGKMEGVGEELSGMEGFSGGVYVLDKSNGEIWKLAASGAEGGITFADKRRWLEGEGETDLTLGVDLAIDGDIWVGIETGEVVRLRRGKRENFSLRGMPEGMKVNRLAVSLDETEEAEGRIAVLDRQALRVVIFNKEGDYVKQLLWEGFGKITDLVFIKGGELMVLGEGKVYRVKI